MEEYGMVAEEGYVRFLMRDTSHAFLSTLAGVLYVPSERFKRIGIQLICWCVDMSSCKISESPDIDHAHVYGMQRLDPPCQEKLFHELRRKDCQA